MLPSRHAFSTWCVPLRRDGTPFLLHHASRAVVCYYRRTRSRTVHRASRLQVALNRLVDGCSTMAEPRGGPDKVMRTDEDKVKFDAGNCEALSKASIKCLEDIGYDRTLAQTVCKPQYDAYRECRKQENEMKRKMRSSSGLFG